MRFTPRHAATAIGAISAHAVVGFAHDALYAATGDMIVKPQLLQWLASYGGYCLAGIALCMLGLQLWIDWPSIHKADKTIEEAAKADI